MNGIAFISYFYTDNRYATIESHSFLAMSLQDLSDHGSLQLLFSLLCEVL